jgi:hypothetical protein
MKKWTDILDVERTAADELLVSKFPADLPDHVWVALKRWAEMNFAGLAADEFLFKVFGEPDDIHCSIQFASPRIYNFNYDRFDDWFDGDVHWYDYGDDDFLDYDYSFEYPEFD